jgi:hypothetical protein
MKKTEENQDIPSKTTIKYFALVSEIYDLNVTGFPNKFPMIFLATQETIDEYNKLMLTAMTHGFDPKTRKMCFTLGCAEGYTHSDIYNLIQTLPEVSEEIYSLLDNIPAWNPVKLSIESLKKYIKLIKTFDEGTFAENSADAMEKVITELQDSADIKLVAKNY